MVKLWRKNLEEKEKKIAVALKTRQHNYLGTLIAQSLLRTAYCLQLISESLFHKGYCLMLIA
jgi:hypothetical protein